MLTIFICMLKQNELSLQLRQVLYNTLSQLLLFYTMKDQLTTPTDTIVVREELWKGLQEICFHCRFKIRYTFSNRIFLLLYC